MNVHIGSPIRANVYATDDGRAVIEQSQGSSSVVVLSADQILTLIEELHECYD